MTAPRVRLDIDTTREKLAALGLGYATSALEGLLSEAVRAEMQAHVFLDRLLDAERSGREERRVRTMLKTAKIPVGATLENFDFAFQPAVQRSNAAKYHGTGTVTEHEVIEGKAHLMPAQEGWEAIADRALDWALAHARSREPQA